MSVKNETLDYLKLATKGTFLTEDILEKVATDLTEKGVSGDIDAGFEYDKDERKDILVIRKFEDNEPVHCYIYDDQGEYETDYSFL